MYLEVEYYEIIFEIEELELDGAGYKLKLKKNALPKINEFLKEQFDNEIAEAIDDEETLKEFSDQREIFDEEVLICENSELRDFDRQIFKIKLSDIEKLIEM
ncbi:hypothetical protein [Hydrogenimonas thermophila]|uniref:Uncharacterized protein n=1 Tax=Hydrogenimonas thermophila TaxID=223786 RepID=A0A1I5UMS5_9BACT|nr:hypothetical protein [Hydrogenimonas thermophila]SFP96347.1 hypothetical protein SAMN05216234_16511 [Hydrogenimonas thermophila]